MTVFPAFSRIKLATLPRRQRVEIMLNNKHYTLVEEERIVPLIRSTKSRGNNRVDFSWSNTRVEKKSIQFRPVAIRKNGRFIPIKKVRLAGGVRSMEVQVLNVSFPPGENALVWEVFAHRACAVKVRVSYLIRNLNRSFSYRALANKAETYLTLRKYIRVRNYSGEYFGLSGIWAGFGKKFHKIVGQKEMIKILIQKFKRIPIRKTFTFDWYTYGRLNAAKPNASRVLMHYELKNDRRNGMGKFPLQPGKVRIFIKDSQGSAAFLGEDWAKLTPIDDKMKLYLGDARDIVCTRKVMYNKRRKVEGYLYNQEIVIRYEIENFKKKACTLRIVEQLNKVANQYFARRYRDVEWKKGSRTSSNIRFDYSKGGTTPVLMVSLPARPTDKNKKVKKVVVNFHFTLKNLW